MFKVIESQITTLATEWWQLVQAGNTPGLSDREAEWYFDAADAIIARLVELPAADASDIAAKVLVCACEYRNGEPLPGTDVHALMCSTVADAMRFAGPGLDRLAENVFCKDDADEPENRQRSLSDSLH
ncbi:MAG TPA: hypothetical protein VN750_27665 [Steroidobacteraceae bacterium]|nr:hypothetical protein [Steroidobacteraceae bacterium]